MRDIREREDGVVAAATVIAEARPDVLLLTEFDYDHDGVALAAFAALLADMGHDLPHRFANEPNSGVWTGEDLDGDGRAGNPEDAQGYGWFAGDGGLAVLSTLPIDEEGISDYSPLLWTQIPGATMPTTEDGAFPSDLAMALQRLSTKAHWAVPIRISQDETLTALVFAASPPVFDGPEDRNGLRNADEIRFWQLWLDGAFGPVPGGPVAVIGNANLDPFDGDGRREAIRALLDDPRLQDPEPRSIGGAMRNDPDHRGDPALDTVDWAGDIPGNLRVSYILPDARLDVLASGVIWPGPGQTRFDDLFSGDTGGASGPHRLVWVDIRR